MLLYTIMPYDSIFGQGPIAQEEQPQTGTSAIQGGFVEWTQVGKNRCVSRVYSTDPSVYLRADYAPGAPWFPKG